MPVALATIPAGYFALMVIGLVRWYTPVPFWDMWDAYLADYLQFLEHGWRKLFVQTNEHRIWFSNVLFFLDLRFFGGASRLLIPANAVLALALWVTLALIARRLLADRKDVWIVLSLVLGPLCFSWLQEQNLTWGFQSQFFAAYLVPLAAFACLANSFSSRRSNAWFAAAIAFGLLSLGTMANGIIVLPLLVVMILAMPRPAWARAGIILVIAGLAITAWFQGYFLVERDRANLSQATTFVLTFLGFPIDAMLRDETGVVDIRWVYLAGLFFVVSAAGFAIRWFWMRAKTDPLMLALVVFLGYVGASCVVIALGRAAIEPNATLVSRYATPALIAWCALAILYAHAFRHARFVHGAVIILGVLAAWRLLPVQRLVFTDIGPEYVQQKWIGALALKMRILDLDSIDNIYPTGTQADIDHILAVADMTEKAGLSIMGDPVFASAVAAVGKRIDEGFHPCAGATDAVEPIKTDDEWARAIGWAFDERAGVPHFAYIAAGETIEGVAVTGYVRRDVVAVVGERALQAGFTGFLRAPASEALAALKIYCAD